jgi:hypothetical protein
MVDIYCQCKAITMRYWRNLALFDAGNLEKEPKAPADAVFGRMNKILSATGRVPADRHRVAVEPPKGVSDFDDL